MFIILYIRICKHLTNYSPQKLNTVASELYAYRKLE